MTYIDGFVAAVPTANREKYKKHAEEAAKVSLITMAKGAVEAETWSALKYKDFVRIANEL